MIPPQAVQGGLAEFFLSTKLQHLINIIIGVTLQFFVTSSSIGVWSCIVFVY